MPAEDNFGTQAPQLNSPASGGFVISPHDTNEFAKMTRGIFVGGAGNVAVVLKDGSSFIFTGVAAGTILPVRAKIVKITGTTATNMCGIY